MTNKIYIEETEYGEIIDLSFIRTKLSSINKLIDTEEVEYWSLNLTVLDQLIENNVHSVIYEDETYRWTISCDAIIKYGKANKFITGETHIPIKFWNKTKI